MNTKYKKQRQEALKMFEEGKNNKVISDELGVSHQLVSYWLKAHNPTPIEEQEELETAKIKASNQKLQDTQRIERKLWRGEVRASNAAEALFQEVLDKLESVKIDTPVCREEVEGGKVGIIQLTDLHFGEVIDLPKNKFNLEIAKERVEKHFLKSKELFKSLNIENVKVLLTGDLLNSDRRVDERLTNACSRAEALIHAFNVISGCLKNLSEDFNIIEVVSVIGNESRIDFDLSSIDKVAINNFDYILHEMLRAVFPNIQFSNFENTNALERVVAVGGVKILVSHGIYNAKKPEDAVIRAKLDFDCDYFLCGHVHNTLITSKFRRSGGLPASNGYSYHQLSILEHISSQNCHWVDGNRLYTIENILN